MQKYAFEKRLSKVRVCVHSTLVVAWHLFLYDDLICLQMNLVSLHFQRNRCENMKSHSNQSVLIIFSTFLCKSYVFVWELCFFVGFVMFRNMLVGNHAKHKNYTNSWNKHAFSYVFCIFHTSRALVRWHVRWACGGRAVGNLPRAVARAVVVRWSCGEVVGHAKSRIYTECIQNAWKYMKIIKKTKKIKKTIKNYENQLKSYKINENQLKSLKLIENH